MPANNEEGEAPSFYFSLPQLPSMANNEVDIGIRRDFI